MEEVSVLKNKIYMIVSKWGYPFGGGEEFLFQSMEWAEYYGMVSYWISFYNAKNEEYDSLEIIKKEHGTLINVPGGFDKTAMTNWIRLLKPDVIHHQGVLRQDFYQCCKMLRIEFVSGYHFWHGAIILDDIKKNIDIIENAKYHQIDPEITELSGENHCTLYCASKFVSQAIEVVTEIKVPRIINAASSFKRCKIHNLNILQNRFVSAINIHKLKGGELLLYLLKNLPDIPFLFVRTEYNSNELDEQIATEIENRNNSILLERTEDIKSIYQQTKILLVTSMVDETFCRVAYEGLMNCVPIITTGQGNIKYMVDKAAEIIPYDNFEAWAEKIKEWYYDKNKLAEYSKKSWSRYEEISEEHARESFRIIHEEAIRKSKTYNVMLFTPWCDQGLGIQSKNYYKILHSYGYRPSVFALKPYNAASCQEMQRDPKEWEAEHIYYSTYDREHVKDLEIVEFVKKHNIGKCILPETCWYRVFEVAQLLRKLGVKCYAVPNIEIVRKDEIYKHRFFHKILCNNYLCQNIFNSHGVNRTQYVGYGINNEDVKFCPTRFDGKDLRFLFIGGQNAFSRKHIMEICEGFCIAQKKIPNIYITCTIQKFTEAMRRELSDDMLKKLDIMEEYKKNPNINIIEEHLAYRDILDLYTHHHISIQVSKHEGLGLGFYEAIYMGTPIITLDTPPHNEIVRNGVNGWVIPCSHIPMVDNKDPIFDSAKFDPKDLADKIVSIYRNPDELRNINSSLFTDLNSRLSIERFEYDFIEAIND